MKNWIVGTTHSIARDILFLIMYELSIKDDNTWSGYEALACMIIPKIIATFLVIKFFKLDSKLPIIVSIVALFCPNLVPNLMLLTGYRKSIKVAAPLAISAVSYSGLYAIIGYFI